MQQPIFHKQNVRILLCSVVLVLTVGVLWEVLAPTGRIHANTTCISAPGPETCTHQSPLVDACYADAQTVLSAPIYSSVQTAPAIGEVDLRGSHRCRAYWGRVISYVGIVQVLYVTLETHGDQASDHRYHAWARSTLGDSSNPAHHIVNDNLPYLNFTYMVYTPDDKARVCASIQVVKDGEVVHTTIAYPGGSPDETQACHSYSDFKD